jgi:hypothetical protein
VERKIKLENEELIRKEKEDAVRILKEKEDADKL